MIIENLLSNYSSKTVDIFRVTFSEKLFSSLENTHSSLNDWKGQWNSERDLEMNSEGDVFNNSDVIPSDFGDTLKNVKCEPADLASQKAHTSVENCFQNQILNSSASSKNQVQKRRYSSKEMKPNYFFKFTPRHLNKAKVFNLLITTTDEKSVVKALSLTPADLELWNEAIHLEF